MIPTYCCHKQATTPVITSHSSKCYDQCHIKHCHNACSNSSVILLMKSLSRPAAGQRTKREQLERLKVCGQSERGRPLHPRHFATMFFSPKFKMQKIVTPFIIVLHNTYSDNENISWHRVWQQTVTLFYSKWQGATSVPYGCTSEFTFQLALAVF